MERRPDLNVGWLSPRCPILDALGERSPGGQGEVGVGRAPPTVHYFYVLLARVPTDISVVETMI